MKHPKQNHLSICTGPFSVFLVYRWPLWLFAPKKGLFPKCLFSTNGNYVQKTLITSVRGKRWDRKIYQSHKFDKFTSKSLFPENDWFTKKSLDILELLLFLFVCFLSFSQCKYYLLQGHSQLWDRPDLDNTFASLKSVYLLVYLNPKSNLRVGYI